MANKPLDITLLDRAIVFAFRAYGYLPTQHLYNLH